MKDEIKEILEIFKQVDLEVDVGGCSNCPRRKDKNKTCIGCLNNAKDKLLDYITNLQEENKESEEAVEYWQKENDKKQEKIDKAIEYMEQCRDTKTKRIDSRLKRVLNILKGEYND